MRNFLLLIFVSVGLSVSAQFGVTGFYNQNNVYIDEEVEVDLPLTNDAYPSGSEIAVNYWFRLPTKRVEFQPTLYYTGLGREEGPREYGFQFKTNLYLFDFGTDCNCPTFGKQGAQLQKGMFLQLSPGVAVHQPAEILAIDYDWKNAMAFTLGAGLGIDFGISNLLTITPIASARYTAGELDNISYVSNGSNVVSAAGRVLTYQIGLQVGFRLDSRNY